MRNKCFIFLLLLLFISQDLAWAQPRHRRGPWWGDWAGEWLMSSGPLHGNGGLVLKYSRFPNLAAINSQLSSDGYKTISTNRMLMIGGIGSALYEENFLLGFEGHIGALSNRGNVIAIDVTGDNSSLTLAYGGLKMAKLFGLFSDLYLLGGGSVGVGGLILSEGAVRKVNRYFLTVEPEIGVLFKLTSFFGIAVTGSYLKSVGLGSTVTGNFPDSIVSSLSLDNWTANVSFLWGGF